MRDITAGRIRSTPAARQRGVLKGVFGALLLALTACVGAPVLAQPALTDMTPNSATAGDGMQVVTVTGSGFITGGSPSVVRWNGAALATTFTNSTTLEATVPAVLIAAPGLFAVTVETPGAGTSEPLSFYVVETGATLFSDSFNRANNIDVGNGWIEKTTVETPNGAFSLVDNQVAKVVPDSGGYWEDIVYRPEPENPLDFEVGMDFIRQSGGNPLAPGHFPQVHARIQRDTVADPNTIHSYVFFLYDGQINPGRLVIGHQPPIAGVGECYMAERVIPGGLATIVVGERYRLRFRVSGFGDSVMNDPVSLTGYLEHFNGASWDEVASLTTQQDELTTEPGIFCDPVVLPPPISGAGSVGFAPWESFADLYDNFYWFDIFANTTVPSLLSLSPDAGDLGGAAFTLQVIGEYFQTDSVVRLNGSDRVTTYVSATELQAAIPAADLLVPGAAQVTVFNPGPGGGQSVEVTFAVGEITFSEINPNWVVEGGPADLQLAVRGAGFTVDTVVQVDGAEVATAFGSAGELTATVPSAMLAAAGSLAITVKKPTVNGDVISSPLSLNVIAADGGFFDGFERADGDDVGSNWSEKTPAAFTLAGGRAVKQGVPSGYTDNVCHRPAQESGIDMSASVEFTIDNPVLPGFPQVLTRIQPDVTDAELLEAYLLFISNDPQAARVRRNMGAEQEDLADIPLQEALATDTTYRLRLETLGNAPVQINAFVEKLDVSGWTVIGTRSIEDADGIADTGMAGFGGNTEGGYAFDNFMYATTYVAPPPGGGSGGGGGDNDAGNTATGSGLGLPGFVLLLLSLLLVRRRV